MKYNATFFGGGGRHHGGGRVRGGRGRGHDCGHGTVYNDKAINCVN